MSTKLKTEDVISVQDLIHLIKDKGLLGKNCWAFEGGYPTDIQNRTIRFVEENHKTLTLTTRTAIRIADNMHTMEKMQQV